MFYRHRLELTLLITLWDIMCRDLFRIYSLDISFWASPIPALLEILEPGFEVAVLIQRKGRLYVTMTTWDDDCNFGGARGLDRILSLLDGVKLSHQKTNHWSL